MFILILLFCVGLFIYLNKETLLYRMLHVLDTSEYIHYSCSHCGRNIYVQYSSLTEDEKMYGLQCGKCTHKFFRKENIEFDLIPVGSEVIN